MQRASTWHSMPALQRAASGRYGDADPHASPPSALQGLPAVGAAARPGGSYPAQAHVPPMSGGEERTVRGRGNALRHLQSAGGGGASSGRASMTGGGASAMAGAAGGSSGGMYPFSTGIIRAGAHPALPGTPPCLCVPDHFSLPHGTGEAGTALNGLLLHVVAPNNHAGPGVVAALQCYT